jgi:hypothetical protein
MFNKLRILLVAPVLLMSIIFSSPSQAAVMRITQVYLNVVPDGQNWVFYAFANASGGTLYCSGDNSEQADKLMLYMALGKQVDVSCDYNTYGYGTKRSLIKINYL